VGRIRLQPHFRLASYRWDTDRAPKTCNFINTLRLRISPLNISRNNYKKEQYGRPRYSRGHGSERTEARNPPHQPAAATSQAGVLQDYSHPAPKCLCGNHSADEYLGPIGACALVKSSSRLVNRGDQANPQYFQADRQFQRDAPGRSAEGLRPAADRFAAQRQNDSSLSAETADRARPFSDVGHTPRRPPASRPQAGTDARSSFLDSGCGSGHFLRANGRASASRHRRQPAGQSFRSKWPRRATGRSGTRTPWLKAAGPSRHAAAAVRKQDAHPHSGAGAAAAHRTSAHSDVRRASSCSGTAATHAVDPSAGSRWLGQPGGCQSLSGPAASDRDGSACHSRQEADCLVARLGSPGSPRWSSIGDASARYYAGSAASRGKNAAAAHSFRQA
jgi:hypothetical protein